MQAITMAETRYPQMAGRWYAMVGNPPKHQRDVERRIFNEYLKARSNKA